MSDTLSVCIETVDPETGLVLDQVNLDLEVVDLFEAEGRRIFSRFLRANGVQQVDRRILDQLGAPSDFEPCELRPVPLRGQTLESYEAAIASSRAARARRDYEERNSPVPFGQQLDGEGNRLLNRVISGHVPRPVGGSKTTLLVGSKQSDRKSGPR